MNIKFNLLSLHDEIDIHSRSWISLKGEKLKEIITKLEQNSLNKSKLTRESLSRKISNELHCSHSVVKRVLQKKNYLPMPIVLKLLEDVKNKDWHIKKINECATHIKVNGGSAKPVKACKQLSLELAKILGAFMADGSMHNTVIFCSKNDDFTKLLETLQSKNIIYVKKYARSRREHYVNITINRQNHIVIKEIMAQFSNIFNIQTHTNLEVADYYFSNVEAFNSWIYNQFKIKPLKFYKRGNAWRTYFCNKILSRYLIQFFDVIPGPKSDTAFESKLIKNSNIRTRTEFAKGVMMFDGCLTMQGTMCIQLNSISLIESLKEIFSKNKIKFMSIKNKHIISTNLENRPSKILSFFEKGTHKYNRLKMISGRRKIEDKFDSYSKLTLIKIFNTIKNAKYCDIEYLMKKFNVRHTTIMIYLRVLKKQRMIQLESKTKMINYIDKKTYIMLKKRARNKLFQKLKNRFTEYQKAAKYFGTNKKAFSLWKLGKNRIPLATLLQMLEITKCNKEEIFRNIKSTDRLICCLS